MFPIAPESDLVPLVGNEGKLGLGTTGAVAAPPLVPTIRPKNSLGPSTMRLAAKTKMLQPPAKAFQDPLNDDSE
ncbi:hypothetical protein MSG28_008666 [Choristoneura fumiferana]|uniref:Uncharacterized protein n=1 Tax=Choristoneura fumiferana TaxID=7141 RepID=A0ACC0J7K0_CHOFU|nr:hypothetical protein MSG28_008666 [Choristoneura fumiferana]